MRIDQTSAYTGATGSSSPGGLDASRDQFLKLFVAQLENQNPLDPQNGADMVAQLAQFSSLEQQVESNRRLDELVAVQDAAAGAGLADLAGREITADVGAITVDGKAELPRIELAGSPLAHAGEVVIHGPSGEVVRRLPIAAGPPPTVAWDGKDAQGAPVPNGAYTLEVEATGNDGAKVTARPQVRGRVDAVELGAEGARLRLGNIKITPASVRSIHGPQGVPS
jgi:flagellar basal-body rod modification protein FlgD